MNLQATCTNIVPANLVSKTLAATDWSTLTAEPEAARAEQTLYSAPAASNAASGMAKLSEYRSWLTFEQHPLHTRRPVIRPFERAGFPAAFHTQGGRPPRSPPAYPCLLDRNK